MGKNILKVNERRNPVMEKSLGNKKGVLVNSERKNKEVKEEIKDWRDQISPQKLEDISRKVPQELWNKLSFHKQLSAYVESKKEEAEKVEKAS